MHWAKEKFESDFKGSELNIDWEIKAINVNGNFKNPTLKVFLKPKKKR